MTELPANVKKQAKKAEELMKKQKEKKQKGQNASPAPENKGQAPQQQQAPAQQQPKPTTDDGRPPEQPSPPPQQTTQQTTDWETKYKVLKGKYDAEVNADVIQLREEINRLKQTNEVLQQRLIEASDTIGTLNEMLAKAQTGQLPAQQMQQQPQQGQYEYQAPPGQQEPVKLLNKEDFEGYGEQFFELVDIINKQAEEIQRLKGLTYQTVELSREEKIDRFYKELKRMVPRYELINIDSRFIKWLEEYDQARGATRWDIFQERCRALDPEGAAYYFNEFIKTLPPHERAIYEVTPTTEQPGQVQSQPQVDYGAQPQEQVQVPGIENQVMPDTSSTGPTFETPAITAQDVQAAAERYSRGKITFDEYLAISKSFQQQIANELRR